MQISKAAHKAFIFNLFYPENQMGIRQERSFPLEQLVDASSALKKIRESANQQKEGEVVTGLSWTDEDSIEFSVGEAGVLAEMVKDIKQATPSNFEVISELKELLK